MMTQADVNRIIFVALTTVVLGLLQRLINCKRQNRGRQVMFPAAAVIYDVAGIIFLLLHYQDLHKLNQFFQALEGCDIVISNLLLVAGFLVVKLVLLKILAGFFRDRERMERFAGSFYEYDEETGCFFLKEQQRDTRYIARGFAIGSMILTILLLSVSWNGGETRWTFNYFFPAAVMIVIWEFWFFINGLTKEEYYGSIGGKSAVFHRVSSFYRIREIYERMFPDQMLSAHTGCEYAAREGTTSMLRDLELSEDRTDQVVARYFNTYGEREKFEGDYVRATNRMMHGESIISFNPFYRDQGKYLILPIVSALLKGKKCMVICGRGSITRDVPEWLSGQLQRYTRLQSMWRVRELDENEPDCEIGVLDFSRIYDVNVLEANRTFFAETGFVLLLEPSLMVNTGQIGLTLLAEEAEAAGNHPVYCICDRYTDGLVDTLSHLLKTEITEVLAMPVPRCTYTGISWNADGDYMRQRLFDKQTRFLGNGLELAAVAVKNQIPEVSWFGETKAPLRDIKWLAGQNFATICRYMNLPVQQKSLYERIRFVPNLWCTSARRQQFVLVEDEFCNMFSMMRSFLSRSEEQTFVNVLSENYLLRDYMRFNQHVFRANPYAVPSLVPDYARTARNVMMKMLILMAVREVSEDEVRNELELVGVSVREPYQALCELMGQYTDTPAGLIRIRNVMVNDEALAVRKTNLFSIPEENFERYFAATLKTAYYIVEDEKRESEYIDAKMFGHVTQTLLPGQFVTYDGKYYQAVRIDPTVGVLLQRASDHYDWRRYYRQIRKYTLVNPREAEAVYDRKIMDFQVTVYPFDISVKTPGYLELKDAGDLRGAKEIFFGEEMGDISYDRRYIRKNVLRIRLADTDRGTRFTTCVLFNELLRSLFPSAWHYIAVLANAPGEAQGMLKYMVYDCEGDLEEDSIYIVEDSDLDLGLLDAVKRNLERIFELMADFLDWHFYKINEPAQKEPAEEEIVLPQSVAEQKRQRLIMRILRRLFGKGEDQEKPKADTEEHPQTPEKEKTGTEEEPKAQEDTKPETEEEPGAQEQEKPETEEEPGAQEQEKPEAEDEPGAQEDTEPGTEEGESLTDDSGDEPETEEPEEPTRYQRECFLKFGFDEIDGRLSLESVLNYLSMHGWSNNDLTKARKRLSLETGRLDLNAENTCDFCGVPLSGVSYDRLNDGRIRCNDCSMTAINQLSEFQELFRRSLTMLEDTYNIQIRVAIAVRTTDAKAIAKHVGMVFRPSSQFDSRVLGFVQKKQGRYTLMIENGSPRLAAIDTITHELTHIWQYLNWDDKNIRQIYSQANKQWSNVARDMVYEGMAMWSAIQMLYVMGEIHYASQQERLTESRKDVYGIGFRLYRRTYDLERNGEIPELTPFHTYPPLDPDEVRELFQGMQ